MKGINIGEAAAASGVSAKMILYYEETGLIGQAGRTDAGYRQYIEEDVQTLRFIKRSRDMGFSLERIKTLLSLWQDRTRASADVRKLARQYIAELDDDIEKLQGIRDQLASSASKCRGDNRPDCPIIDELASPRRLVAAKP